MKRIVVTGGVGSGKSEALSIISEISNSKIVRADDVAKKLMSPGSKCYFDIINAFSDESLTMDNSDEEYPALDKKKLSRIVFSDEAGRKKINEIVHPAVKRFVIKDIESEEKSGKYDYYFFETALAIEEKYDKLFDEVWYICAGSDARRKRLQAERGYSKDRIDEIFSSQKSEEEFTDFANRVIDNNGTHEELISIIKALFVASEPL